MKIRSVALSSALLALLACGTSQAATYSYDGNTPDWYTAGNFTRANNQDPGLPYLINDLGTSNMIRAWYWQLNYGAQPIFLNSWAGATWTAPAGERIVKVTMSGWYRTDGGQTGIGVFGGSSSFEEKNYLTYKAPENPSWPWHQWDNQVVSIPSSDNCSKLELRSLWMITNDATEMMVSPNQDGSYRGDISSVQIQTSSGPDLMGTINLSDYGQDPSSVAISLEVRRNWESGNGYDVLRAEDIVLDSAGKFGITGLDNGTYDVSIKACTWLRKTFSNVEVNGPTDLGDITLMAGDLDGDNEITSTDLSILGLGLGVAGDE